MQLNDHYVDERQAAAFLGCSTAALRRWRRINRGPAFARFGRLVRYKLSALEEFALENTRRFTADGGRADGTAVRPDQDTAGGGT